MCSKIHMPVVVLPRLVTRKLGLPHVGRQMKPIFGIVERNQVRQTIENPPQIAPGGIQKRSLFLTIKPVALGILLDTRSCS
jgi:hypothetical protein